MMKNCGSLFVVRSVPFAKSFDIRGVFHRDDDAAAAKEVHSKADPEKGRERVFHEQRKDERRLLCALLT